ncbi:hypothetical protein [Tautonia marina]|uniref:hypothetical protein n=1 Tax=Tautonia marina TaxID=2653855 RepID=UPI00126097C7|nr:hypothetical protein [Tautonia marina]
MAATTLKQTLANRLNALLSTGPKSSEGKARSSRNAQSHGLSKLGTHRPADMAEAIETRKVQWHNDYRPEGPTQTWLFDRLVAESVRLDSCEARIVAARAEQAERASESWDDDRAADIASLAARLPQQPERIQAIMLQSKHGVLWLLDRWAEVLDSLTRHEGWTRDTWNLALDLLGVSPFARDGSGPWDLDPDDKTEAPGLALVTQATEALRARLDAFLNARDDRARRDAEAGLATEDPRPIRLLERYAADARRQFFRHLNELRRLQSGSPRAATAQGSSTPDQPPGPRPDRSRPHPQPAAETEAHPAPPPSEPPATVPTAPPTPARNEPIGRPSIGRPSLRPALPGASVPLNRRARRAQAAAARRS